jgi:hypothetical protein
MTREAYSVEIKRAHVVMASTVLKSFQAESKWYGKIVVAVAAKVDEFLEKHKGDRFRITAECIDDEGKES